MRLVLIINIFLLTSACYGQSDSVNRFRVYKLKPDTLVAGFEDQLGRQGSFFTYHPNGNVEFIRTYRNDTLNGFLGHYNPDGFVISEQFYRGGRYEGLRYEYSGENKLELHGNYKQGLKHGVFMEFYDNGDLKYEGFFQNGSMVGYEIHYYPDRQIRSIGNTDSGDYRYFDENGRLSSIITREKGVITRIQVHHPDSLTHLKPTVMVKKRLRSKGINNQTSLKVEELCSDTQRDFLTEASISKRDSCLVIRMGKTIYFVEPGRIYQCNNCQDYDSRDDFSVPTFGTNGEIYLDSNNEEAVRYIDRDEVVYSKNFKIVVHRKSMHCMDTGNNPLTIEYKGKSLMIDNLKNIQVFEYDLDKNGQNEIYVISFQSCEGLYRILKIS